MARADAEDRRFETPKGIRRSAPFRGSGDNDRFGRFTEWVARGMGTPGFLLGLSVFAITWMAWNTFAPEPWRFDSIAIGFTGKAPDLGCYEVGKPLPHYGPRL